MVTDAKIAQLVKIARLYYLEGMNQRTIAARMWTSVAGVSRSIAKARDLRIVRISIEAPDKGLSELEISLERKFDLEECLLVETSPTLEVMYAEMASKLFELLDRTLTPKSNVGVSWGRTLKTIGDNLPTRTSRCASVIPMVGGVGRIETGIFPNSIARQFAQKLNGDGHLVNVPALVASDKIRRSLISDESFAPVAALWDKLDIALFSVGSMTHGASVRDLHVVPAEILERAAADGASFMANFLFFDSEGNRVETAVARRIIAIQHSKLMSVPRRIIVAGGSEKTMAVRGALQAGLCNVLVSDRATAEALLHTGQQGSTKRQSWAAETDEPFSDSNQTVRGVDGMSG